MAGMLKRTRHSRKPRQRATHASTRSESGAQDKYLPQEAYLILRRFHDTVTAYPSEKQTKELASVITKLSGAEGCTESKIAAYFKQRRRTVARTRKSETDAPSTPTPLVIRIRPLQKTWEKPKCASPSTFPARSTEPGAEELARKLREALSGVSAQMLASDPPKTFAELGKWYREKDTVSQSLLDSIAAGKYKRFGLE